ncbi:hypothetical protein MAR_014437 [Mya arenaria]|uniref:VWFD domain-containing protein n=1 Tax=Mya arenaria TaxID=6604 RepID=A0ABY7G6C9_MYAAR|nr:hypothetical protein MAR_014437 [Mya arenaria]
MELYLETKSATCATLVIRFKAQLSKRVQTTRNGNQFSLTNVKYKKNDQQLEKNVKNLNHFTTDCGNVTFVAGGVVHYNTGTLVGDTVSFTCDTDSSILQQKQCYSNNDPHMKTFDGITYENQNEDRFLLYKNQAFQQQVTFPSGTIVDLSLQEKFVNVAVFPSLADLNNTEGLCGRFDGDTVNDRNKRPGSVENDPALSWRLLEHEDLFGEKYILEHVNESMKRCSCNTEEPEY